MRIIPIANTAAKNATPPRGGKSPSNGSQTTNDDRIARALEEYCLLLDEPQPPDRANFLAKYPDVAPELADCLDGLDFLRTIAPQAENLTGGLDRDDPSSDGVPLGDFRIVREIGRGGMGVVYEAEQLSMGRRMAIKMLPFAPLLDRQQLTRFKNEARAAGTLDHPNIVAVHSVGEERGIHYYAMQLVRGKNLAEVIAELRDGCGESRDSKQLVSRDASAEHSSCQQPIANSQQPETVAAALSTVRTTNPQESFRQAALLIADAADALDYAHNQGVIHRDIKPANLLLDEQSRIFITDFGLARLEAGDNVTLTGDVLGTLRYMSPEQASGKPGTVDYRTDIHALGATLYELLALRPAFDFADRAVLLQRITNDAPPSLRQTDSRIPADLATIIGKAMEKDPADRYESAAAMASDLRAFAEHRPITAKPPSLATRTRKWVQRHTGAVVTTLVVLFLAVAGLATATLMLNAANAQAAAERMQAAAEKTRAERNLDIAVDAIDHLLTRFADDAHLHGYLHPAETLLSDAVGAYERVLSTDDNPAFRAKAAAARVKLASVLLARQEVDAADMQLTAAERLLDDLPPESPEQLATRAEALAARADLLMDRQQYDEAGPLLQRVTAIHKQLASAEPSDADRQQDLLLALIKQVELAIEIGDLDVAQQRFQRCTTIVAAQPAGSHNPAWSRQHSRVHRLAGEIATKRGEHDKAVEAFAFATKRQQDARIYLPDSVHLLNELYECRHDHAAALVRAGRFDEAATQIATFSQEFPDNLQAYVDGFDLLLYCVEAAEGDADARTTYLQQAKNLIRAAPSANYFPADARRALAWRLATCPYRELRDGERAEQIATYLCFRDYQDAKNLITHSAAMIEGNKPPAVAAGGAQNALISVNENDDAAGAAMALLAIARARQGQLDESAEWLTKAEDWKRKRQRIEDRGMNALFEQAFADHRIENRPDSSAVPSTEPK